MAEQLCCSFGRHHQVRTAIVRFFSVYGPELRKQLLWDASLLITRGENGFFGTGEEQRDLIHVTDAVSLVMAAAGHASTACPTVNGGTGVGVQVREVLAELFRTFGRPDVPVFFEQARAGDPPVYIASTERARSWGWALRSMAEGSRVRGLVSRGQPMRFLILLPTHAFPSDTGSATATRTWHDFLPNATRSPSFT
jgi:UDP-glucose 4-epimerase